MKEAMGEANLTTITILLIGSIIAVASLFIPRIMKTMRDRACCLQNGGELATGRPNGANPGQQVCKIYYTIGETKNTWFFEYNINGFDEAICNHGNKNSKY